MTPLLPKPLAAALLCCAAPPWPPPPPLLPQVVNTMAPVDGKAVKVGWEGTACGFRTDAAYSGNELAQGTECRMVRPAGL